VTSLDPPGTDDLVWYAAFGSNLSPVRLGHYLRGGRPSGARRHYEGGRDTSPPRDQRVLTLPGRLRFAGRSTVWGGGLAFYVPGTAGQVHARAYLLGFGQFSDLVAQEARQPVGADLVLADDGPTLHGLSRVYDAVLDVGRLDGHRVLTLTTTGEPAATPPSAAYLRTMLSGLADGFAMTPEQRVEYLLAADGVSPPWTAADLRALLNGGGPR
jgi:hypothetical protein